MTIKLATGRQLPGEVIRKNAERDVALIKVNENTMTALPVDFTEPNVGVDIFAAGTPLYLHLATTITKGIVSGYGEYKKMRVINMDASIREGNSGGPVVTTLGNVIGIAVAGTIDSKGINASVTKAKRKPKAQQMLTPPY